MYRIFISFVISLLIYIILFLIYINITTKKIKIQKENKVKIYLNNIKKTKIYQKKESQNILNKENKKTNNIYSNEGLVNPIFFKKKNLGKLLIKNKKDIIVNQDIYNLYENFDNFTKNQKIFIKNKLDLISYITQINLWKRTYPKEAILLKKDGDNILEFYLYPNGDISNIKIIKSINYILDENSIETIKASFKDYPKPKEKTLIRFLISYRLNRY